MMYRGVDSSILDGDTIFDNTIDGFSTEFDVDSSMESMWNSTWICSVNSLEIPWNPQGIHMD